MYLINFQNFPLVYKFMFSCLVIFLFALLSQHCTLAHMAFS